MGLGRWRVDALADYLRPRSPHLPIIDAGVFPERHVATDVLGGLWLARLLPGQHPIEFGPQSADSFAGWIDATIRFDLAGETPVLVVSQNGEDIACARLTSSGS